MQEVSSVFSCTMQMTGYVSMQSLLLCDNEWKGHFLQMWMIGHPSQGLRLYMSKRRGADSHGRNDRWLKASSLCCPFILSFSPHSVFLFFYSIPSLWLLPPCVHFLPVSLLTLCFCLSVHVRGCEDQWPGSGPLHCMERQFHHWQSRED